MALVTAPLGCRDNFPYRKLEHREIRLVVVKKHSHWPRENSLTCSIQHMVLPEDSAAPIAYTALSYTWGDGKNVTSLKLLDESTGKSGVITVTTYLVSALQTILKPGKRHCLWIDQICIDQSNTEEKGEQVQLMRWIYERAGSVRAWVGPADEDSNEAMLYLEKTDGPSLLRDLSDLGQTCLTLPIEMALESLFRRPYWTRTWALQEATALRSGQAVISCGHKSIPLECMFLWIDAAVDVHPVTPNIYRLYNVLEQGIVTMHHFWVTRWLPVRALAALTNHIRELESSDPRDKIYSMLNFATDIQRSEITPDYTKTVIQTYTEVVLWSIGPSWVPDWSKPTTPLQFRKRSKHEDLESSPLYRASGDYVRGVGVRHVDANTRLLSLSGVRVGNLDNCLNKAPTTLEAWPVQETWQPEDGDLICPLNMICVREVFRRTMYLDRRWNEHEEVERGNTHPLPWDMEHLNISEEQIDTTNSFKFWSYGRCPFYTKPCVGSSQGLLGYSVDTAKPGDELWIVKGGTMPFVLRPKAMTVPHTDLGTGEAFELPVDAGMPTYQLVGEAFVLGLMDGEIIDMLGDTPKRERPAPLADMDREFRTIGLI